MTTKEELHRLVDELPESELLAARRFLEYLRVSAADPVLQALLLAPEDDELETPEEAAAVEEAREDIRQGRVRPWSEVREELLKAKPRRQPAPAKAR